MTTQSSSDSVPSYATDLTKANIAYRDALVQGKGVAAAKKKVRELYVEWETKGKEDHTGFAEVEKQAKQKASRYVDAIENQVESKPRGYTFTKADAKAAYDYYDLVGDAYNQGTGAQQDAAIKDYRKAYDTVFLSREGGDPAGPKTYELVFNDSLRNKQQEAAGARIPGQTGGLDNRDYVELGTRLSKERDQDKAASVAEKKSAGSHPKGKVSSAELMPYASKDESKRSDSMPMSDTPANNALKSFRDANAGDKDALEFAQKIERSIQQADKKRDEAISLQKEYGIRATLANNPQFNYDTIVNDGQEALEKYQGGDKEKAEQTLTYIDDAPATILADKLRETKKEVGKIKSARTREGKKEAESVAAKRENDRIEELRADGVSITEAIGQAARERYSGDGGESKDMPDKNDTNKVSFFARPLTGSDGKPLSSEESSVVHKFAERRGDANSDASNTLAEAKKNPTAANIEDYRKAQTELIKVLEDAPSEGYNAVTPFELKFTKDSLERRLKELRGKDGTATSSEPTEGGGTAPNKSDLKTTRIQGSRKGQVTYWVNEKGDNNNPLTDIRIEPRSVGGVAGSRGAQDYVILKRRRAGERDQDEELGRHSTLKEAQEAAINLVHDELKGSDSKASPASETKSSSKTGSKDYKVEKSGHIRIEGESTPIGNVKKLSSRGAAETSTPWWVSQTYIGNKYQPPYAFGRTKAEAIENAVAHVNEYGRNSDGTVKGAQEAFDKTANKEQPKGPRFPKQPMTVDLDGDGKVEKDEKEVVSAKSAVSTANTKRLDLDISPDNPKLRDAHGHWLSKSEDLAEAVAEYKDNRDGGKSGSSAKSERKAVGAGAGAGASDKRPSSGRKGGRGKVRY